MARQQRQQAVLHERRLSVEDIDRGIGGFAVDQHRHPDLFHAFQHRRQCRNIGDAVMRVGGGAGGIEFRGNPHTLGMAAFDLVRRGHVGEIAGHQRLEVGAFGARRENAVTIGARGFHRRHRRHQVRHDDAARELRGGERQHGVEHRSVAQMHVPVVRPADGDGGNRRGIGRRLVEHRVETHAVPLPRARNRALETPACVMRTMVPECCKSLAAL